jgi:hypothetical protein
LTCEEEEGVVREKDVDVHESSTTGSVRDMSAHLLAAKERRYVASPLAASALARTMVLAMSKE